MRLILSLLCLLFLLPANVSGKEKPSTQKSREIIDHNAEITRSSYDQKIDAIIQTALGDGYRRANIYDFYPMTLPSHKARGRNQKERKELLDYYDYARKDLEKLNQSKLLRTISLDFNLDKTPDHAIIVHNIKKKSNYLAILNRSQSLLLEEFKQSYLELMNRGRYPTTVIYEQGMQRKVISSPSIRLVAFDSPSYLLYYDRKESKWEKLLL